MFGNVFKKKEEDIQPQTINPIINQLCWDLNIDERLFTDGSKIVDSVAYAVVTSDYLIKSNRLNPKTSVFTSEAVAILAAIRNIKRTEKKQ